MKIKKEKKEIEISDCYIKRLSLLGMARGLMFRKKEKSPILLFEFNKCTKEPIHSFFVFFPFVAIWLDKDKKVIDIRKVKSFKFGIPPSRKFRYLIEVPINENYDEVLKIIDGGETFK